MASIENIKNTRTLGNNLEELDGYYKDIYADLEEIREEGKSLIVDADTINNVIEKKSGQEFAKMKEVEYNEFINKVYFSYLYLYGLNDQLSRKIFNEADQNKINLMNKQIQIIQQKMQVLNAMITMAITCRGKANQALYVFNELEKNHFHFKEFFEKNIIETSQLNEIQSSAKAAYENKIHFRTEFQATLQYTVVREKLEAAMNSVSHVSKLMRYVYGENQNGTLRTRYDNQEIDSLDNKLAKISDNKEITYSERLKQIDQVVLDTYLQVRNDQGWRDSKLANALEDFCRSEQGLDLEKKYSIKIPHKVSGDSIILADITIEKQLMKLQEQLFENNLKTQKTKMRDDLLEELRLLKEDDKISALEKIVSMQRSISDSWTKAQIQADNRWFYHQSNYADALKGFMKNQFGMEVKDMQEMLKDKKDVVVELKNTIK